MGINGVVELNVSSCCIIVVYKSIDLYCRVMIESELGVRISHSFTWD